VVPPSPHPAIIHLSQRDNLYQPGASPAPHNYRRLSQTPQRGPNVIAWGIALGKTQKTNPALKGFPNSHPSDPTATS